MIRSMNTTAQQRPQIGDTFHALGGSRILFRVRDLYVIAGIHCVEGVSLDGNFSVRARYEDIEVVERRKLTVRDATDAFIVAPSLVRYGRPSDGSPVRWGMLKDTPAPGLAPYLRASMTSNRAKLTPNGSSAWGWPVEIGA
jgi:hypothetical protein